MECKEHQHMMKEQYEKKISGFDSRCDLLFFWWTFFHILCIMVIIVFVDKVYQLDVPLNVTVKKIIEQFMSLIEEKVLFFR